MGDGPGDAELTNEGITDGEHVMTEPGVSLFPARADVIEGLVSLLQERARSSREMEGLLADKFQLSEEQRRIKHPSGMPVWRNRMAFALKELIEAGRMEGCTISESRARAPRVYIGYAHNDS